MHCKYLIYGFLCYIPIFTISMLIWIVSRMIIFRYLVNEHYNKLQTYFPGIKTYKDFPPKYGLGEHFFKFEKMIFSKNKILTEGKKKVFIFTYWSGFGFYIGIAFTFLVMFVCVLSLL